MPFCKTLKNEIGLTEMNISTGTFFISFQEYIKNFAWTFVCKYEDNYQYRFKRFTIGLL